MKKILLFILALLPILGSGKTLNVNQISYSPGSGFYFMNVDYSDILSLGDTKSDALQSLGTLLSICYLDNDIEYVQFTDFRNKTMLVIKRDCGLRILYLKPWGESGTCEWSLTEEDLLTSMKIVSNW